MLIRFNDRDLVIDADSNLKQVLEKQGIQDEFFAIAINKNFIPRKHYAVTMLKNNDHIEVITPMQGG